MRLIKALLSAWKDLMSQKDQEAELDEELNFHLEMQQNENRRNGMNHELAQRSAKLELGGIEQIKEEVRSQRFGFWFEMFLKDAGYGLRMLRKTPALTFVSLLTLALSIGACTALFSIFYGVLLKPLPYPRPQQLIQIWENNLEKGISKIGVAGLNLEDWRERTDCFNGIAAYYTMGRTLTSGNDSEVVLVSQVSSDFFRIFNMPPFLGRTFTEEESIQTKYSNALGVISADPVAVISHGLWQRRFGGDPKIIGKKIVLDRKSWKVVGVMPSQFSMPETNTALWIPWSLKHNALRDQHFADVVARMKDGITTAQAEQQINEVARQLAAEFPDTNKGWQASLLPLQEALTGDLKQLLWALLAAVGLVLTIACLNVAILQLSKATARLHESSIRLALGASRSRLVRQFLIESFILAFVGGIAGIVLAFLGIEWLQQIQIDLPRINEVTINTTVLFASIGITVFSALLFGIAPAFCGVESKKYSSMQTEGTRTTSRISTQRLRNTLVAVEVGLAVILLASCGMLIRSFMELRAVNPGFESQKVLVLPIFLDTEQYNSGEKTRSYYKRLIGELKELSGVVSVGGATALPTSPLGPDFERPVWDQSSLGVEQNKRSADVRMVTPDYFRTLKISVLRGRGFSDHDGPEATKVLIVNQTLAKQIWPNGNPIGKQLVVDYSSAGIYPYSIVGVVNDVRFHGPRSEPRPEIYFPHAQRPYMILNIAIRTTNDPKLLIGSVREILRRIDPQKPAHNITPLEDLVGATVIRDRYAMNLVACFAIVALLLAVLGIYGVLSFFVRQKMQEIGIRLALGAHQNQISRWITQQGVRLLFVGVVSGLLGAIAFSRLLSGILYQVSPLDFWSLAIAVFALSFAALAAAWIPAQRAGRIEPSIALRYE